MIYYIFHDRIFTGSFQNQKIGKSFQVPGGKLIGLLSFQVQLTYLLLLGYKVVN
jgi:hypothetical protein